MITPQEEYTELPKALGFSGGLSVFFKREDMHPYGSHKGRSIPVMIDKYIKEGFRHFALSSSGNAALAAAMHVKKINIELEKSEKDHGKIVLEILVGKNISSKKLEKITGFKDAHILISIQDRPLQALTMKLQDPSIKSLRQSTDDAALNGYESLAMELEQIPHLRAIFIGTSSGTTAQALCQYFLKKKKAKENVEIHIVQTTSCHRIADAFVNNTEFEEKSLADAIVDQAGVRKDVLVPLIHKSNGGGWIASNEQIISAQDFAQKNTGVTVSSNSALSIAGLMQAAYTGKTWKGSVVCMICGD